MADFWQNLANIAEQPISEWIGLERAANVSLLGSGNWVEVVGRLSLFRSYVEGRIEDIFERCLVPVTKPGDEKLIAELWEDNRDGIANIVGACDECDAVIRRAEEDLDRFVIIRCSKDPRFLSVPIKTSYVKLHETSVSDFLVALGTSWYCGADAHDYAANARAIFCDAFAHAWEVAGSPDPRPEE